MQKVRHSRKSLLQLSLITCAAVRTIEGNHLDIKLSSAGYTVSGSDIRQRDVYAANGVLHTVSSLLLPPGSLKLTPEKYLLALNCTSFISHIRSVNLTSLITNPDATYTILAPRDDVLSVAGGDGLPEKGTVELKKALRYHFIPGKWTANKLKDGLLLETELVEEGLAGGRQVLEVGISTKKDLNGDKTRKELYFAGAGVVGDPSMSGQSFKIKRFHSPYFTVEINNTIIYLVTRPLAPPVDVLQAALPSLHLSTYLAAVFSTSLANTVKNLPRTTFLIPRNSAWEKLGLVTSYLLMSSSKTDLESVILHHALDSVQYLQSMLNGTDRSFRTVEGTDVSITRKKNESGKTEVFIGPSGGWDGLQRGVGAG
jgi:solute carrier family 25 carnitine/acylcarnitine transporter 20/29